MPAIHLLLITILSLAFAPYAAALTCPSMPAEVERNWSAEAEVAAGKIGPLTAAQLKTKAASQTRALIKSMPDGQIVYLEQMMFASYCSAIRDSELSEREKLTLLREAMGGVRAAIRRAPAAKPLADKKPVKKPERKSEKTKEVVGSVKPAVPASSPVAIAPPTLLPPYDDAWMSEKLSIEGGYYVEDGDRLRLIFEWTDEDGTYRDFFRVVGGLLNVAEFDSNLRVKMSWRIAPKWKDQPKELKHYEPRIPEGQWIRIREKLKAHDLIAIEPLQEGSSSLKWRLTEIGARHYKDIIKNAK